MRNVLLVIVSFVGLVILIVIALGLHAGSNTMQNVHIPFSPSQKPKTIGWIPFWDQEAAKESFFAHSNLLNYVSAFWYKVTPDGQVAPYSSTFEDPSIISYAHQHNVKIFALVANLADNNESGGWDASRVDKAIDSEDARQRHIQELISLTKSKGFDGIDIDYENLREDQKDNFSLFIEELSQQAHKNHLLVGVAILPKTSEDNPNEQNGSQAQDLVRLSHAADQLYFMTYLEHGVFSEPGPPASLDWIHQVISYALSIGVPAQKIYMGVGLVGISWREDPGGIQGDNPDLTFATTHDIAVNMGITPEWDTASQTPHFDFSDENGTHIIWFENDESISKRLEMAKELHVGGIAFWRLGGEDPAMWQSLQQIL